MRRSLYVVTPALLLTAALLAQTSDKPVVKPAGLGKIDVESNQDVNIRAYIQLLRSDVKKQLSQIMTQVMRLDADQAAKFWPVYQEFETQRAVIGDQIVGLLRNYAENYNAMTPAVADQLALQLLSIEQQRNDLKKRYYERVKTELDAITAARFLQVENQLENLLDLQMAAQLPVIGLE